MVEPRLGSIEHDNGGTVIKPNALAVLSHGRWHRVFDGPVSVKWFGAEGSGSGNDTDTIQAAINAAAAKGIPIACLVSGILVKYVGPTPKPKFIDGIVTSQGTRGLIQSCVVDRDTQGWHSHRPGFTRRASSGM